jgi:benzoyl-CoA-dihydrodiol lyase
MQVVDGRLVETQRTAARGDERGAAAGLREGPSSASAPVWNRYELKLNSYDLGVDIELYDVVERLRFEHPEVKVLVVTSATDRVFCAGANIRMLAQSTHAFKVNFCKFTNETRCSLEEPEGPRVIAAVNGACAGGGYELALACHEIYLVDDGSSAVSLPEVPLLGVLPGTGGLTRLTDKRKVRRDLADLFCTKAEGFKARDALKGRFVDGTFPRSRWAEGSSPSPQKAAAKVPAAPPSAGGVTLNPLKISAVKGGLAGEHVSVTFDDAGRTATLTVKGPTAAPPATHEALLALGDGAWSIAAFRELERLIFELRFNHPTWASCSSRRRGRPGPGARLGRGLGQPRRRGLLARHTDDLPPAPHPAPHRQHVALDVRRAAPGPRLRRGAV